MSEVIDMLNTFMDEITKEIHPSLVPFHKGLRILRDVIQYLDGSNPAPGGGVSWVLTWWKSEESREIREAYFRTHKVPAPHTGE